MTGQICFDQASEISHEPLDMARIRATQNLFPIEILHRVPLDVARMKATQKYLPIEILHRGHRAY